MSTSEIPIVTPNENSSIARTVAVMSGKGGVGKSTVTALLAVHLQRQGLKVGILDGDITGPSIPRLFGVGRDDILAIDSRLPPAITKTGLLISSINLYLEDESKPVIWRGPLIGGAITQFFSETTWGELDLLLVDLPPGTGDAPLSTLQSLPVDGVIIVSSPQDLAVLVVEKAIHMVQSLNKPIVGLVENMVGVVCPHCHQQFHILGESQGAQLAAKHGIPWLGHLPMDPGIAQASGQIEAYTSPVQDSIAHMAEACMGRV